MSLFTAVVAIFLLFGLLSYVGRGKPDAPAAAPTVAATTLNKPAEKTAAQREYDAIFSRAMMLTAAVKKTANDPSSIQVTEAFYVPDGTVVLEFRGRNAFNALIKNVAILTPDGKSASGTESQVAALWNKRVANKPTVDITTHLKGNMDVIDAAAKRR